MGVVIGVIVLVLSIGFVVLMAYSEWSAGPQDQAAVAPSPEPLPEKTSAKRKSSRRAPARKKSK